MKMLLVVLALYRWHVYMLQPVSWVVVMYVSSRKVLTGTMANTWQVLDAVLATAVSCYFLLHLSVWFVQNSATKRFFRRWQGRQLQTRNRYVIAIPLLGAFLAIVGSTVEAHLWITRPSWYPYTGKAASSIIMYQSVQLRRMLDTLVLMPSYIQQLPPYLAHEEMLWGACQSVFIV